MNTKINMDTILKCLPPAIGKAAATKNATEILLISQSPPVLYINGDSFYVTSTGEITRHRNSATVISKKEFSAVFHGLCENSVYSVENEIKNGFFTIEGGHRIGICGSGVIRGGEIAYIKDISALNIRIARQIVGKGAEVLPHILDKYLKNTLIISPPGCGKTTMLRDLSRILSSGYKIGIADERGEIAASFKGISMHDVGEKTVVMNCVPKAEAMNMMIRSMGIDVVITDEIGSAEDASAILNALYAGVKVIASAHGYSYSDVCLRPDLKKLISSGGFEKFIVLSRRFGPGTVEEVVNYAG